MKREMYLDPLPERLDVGSMQSVASAYPASVERIYSGPVVAATLAPILGFFTLMVTHHLSRLTKGLDQFVHSFGLWIPGAIGSGPNGSIGSYSGKETLALIVWGISWVTLHFLWRRQDFSIRHWIPIFLGLLGLVTVGFFHPVIDPLVLWLASLAGVA
ncbi:hypothetical protein ACW73L_19810 [Methylolobus aquaticus]